MGALMTIVGIGLLIVAFVFYRQVQSELSFVDGTAFTSEQLKLAHKATLRGRAPENPDLLELSLKIAESIRHNVPLTMRYIPLIYAGSGLVLAGVYLLMPGIPIGAGAGMYLGGILGSMYFTGRAMRNAKKLLAAYPPE